MAAPRVGKVVVRVRKPRWKACATCKGKGVLIMGDDSSAKCPDCQGAGQLYTPPKKKPAQPEPRPRPQQLKLEV